jgi:FKBP-type peptidyl-prolyl cis-trans isomerase FklB
MVVLLSWPRFAGAGDERSHHGTLHLSKGPAMRKPLSLAIVVAALAPLALWSFGGAGEAPRETSAEPAEGTAIRTAADLKTTLQRASYAIGTNIGRNLRSQGLEVDAKALSKGIVDALAGVKLLLEEAEMREVLQALQQEMMAKREAAGAAAQKKGQVFLEANGKKPDVTVLPSGLQYKVLEEGSGSKPKATDTVRTHYRGTLIDGTEFDSSYARGEPATFPLNRVIRGWTEALQLMPVGAKWQLFIPADLAYGARGSPPNIGPNETLIFEIELLGIE